MSALPQTWRDCSHGHVAIQWDAFMCWNCPLCKRTAEIEEEIADLKREVVDTEAACDEAEAAQHKAEDRLETVLRRTADLSMALQDVLAVACQHGEDCGKATCEGWAEHKQARKALESE